MAAFLKHGRTVRRWNAPGQGRREGVRTTQIPSALALGAAAALLLTTHRASGTGQGGQYVVRANLEYCREPVSLKRDAHLPPGEGPFPAIILVHGGGWVGGDKTAEFIRPLFAPLDRTGFPWFSIDYRLAPQHPYPAAARDVERAVAWVKEHAREFKVDAKRIALVGESAGAHLASMVGARNRPPADVQAVVAFYGPFDLVRLFQPRPEEGGMPPRLMKDVFQVESLDDAGLAALREASPATYISPRTPPFLLIHGTADPVVPYDQSTLASGLFKKARVPCELFPVPGGVHGVINWEREPRLHAYKQRMIDWLRRALTSPSPGRTEAL